MGTQLDDKIQELESYRKKRNYTILTLVLVILGIFAALFITANFLNNEKTEALDKSNETVLEEINAERVLVDKKNNKDSIIKYTSEVYVRELEVIKQKILRGTTQSERTSIVNSIDSMQKIALQVSRLTSDTVPFRYYRRPNDNSEVILNIVKASKTPHFEIDSIYEVNDDKMVNTLYYGSLVNKLYVDSLVAKLRSKNVLIKNVKQFKGKRGSDWKRVTVQLEYEIDSSQIGINKNNIWNVKFYSYKPNKATKEIARRTLVENGYNLELFPDWERKLSFFSDYPVILFYDPKNESKAKEIAEMLNNATGLTFVTESGDGLGVSKEDKAHLFIVHYNGS